MPFTVYTPNDIAAMSWHARQKATTRMIREARQLVEADPIQSVIEWAESVRQDARELLAAMPADPKASEHRRAVA
jgi:hypothetical protein